MSNEKDIQKLTNEIITAAKNFAYLEVYFREDWQVFHFTVLGKQVAMIGENKEGKPILTVKGMPEENEKLRYLYDDVVPGYYCNKQHWNSIFLTTDSFTTKELIELLEKSYLLIIKSLPKKVQKELQIAE